MYVNLGYAVVATDYAGLGTAFPSAVLDMQSNALDVIYSVRAARAAVPQLGPRWVAMGESQGGLAAVGVAEAESEMRDSNYLGSITISDAADAQEVWRRLAQGPSRRILVLAHTVKTLYPEFEVEEMLNAKALPLYHDIEQACDLNAGPELPANEVIKADWDKKKLVQEFFRRNTPGQKRAYSPLLVISGEADPLVPVAVSANIVTRLCKQGDRVQFYKFPDLDASGVIGGSVRDQINWIEARFAGRPPASNCP
jgi:pimeloyl-ACP methyl ester carboxylesterase